MAMYFWNGVAYNRAVSLYVWNGSWNLVLDCWIWDGSAWQHCHSTTFGTPVSIDVTPSFVFLSPGGLQNFTATGVDAFGNTGSISVSWSVISGSGVINPINGHYTAPGFTGDVSFIQATSGSLTGTAEADT